jgi:acyl-CoA synthetase (AMP-forming)/AMP-acid ligase II
MLLGDLAHRGATLFGDRPAFRARGETRSFGDVAARVDRLTSLLAGAGVGAGTRIATLSGNDPEIVEAVLAASRLGAVVVPLNVRLLAAELAFQIEDSGTSHALVHPLLEPLARAAGLLERTSWTIGPELDAALEGARAVAVPRASPEAAVVQLYTSGTTGRPKGCLLSQAGWLASNANLAHGLGISTDDRLLAGMPLFHVAGLGLVLTHFTLGALSVMPGAMDPATVWGAVRTDRATTIPAPGVGALLADASREGVDASCVRTVLGAAGSEPAALELLAESLPGATWRGIYGSTEAGNVVTLSTHAEEIERPGTLGRPLFGFDVAVRDEASDEVAPGAVGELCLRGPSTMVGYAGLAGETATALRDGWLHTGDLVRLDDDGYLFFVDRSKDMIKTGGENVYSVEVEQVLLAHPAVVDVAVVGVPDRRWGEAVKAVVVPAPGATFDPAGLDAWCLDRIGAYKRPRWYEPAESIPRSPLGKVLKADLRAAHDPTRARRLPERS